MTKTIILNTDLKPKCFKSNEKIIFFYGRTKGSSRIN